MYVCMYIYILYTMPVHVHTCINHVMYLIAFSILFIIFISKAPAWLWSLIAEP